MIGPRLLCEEQVGLHSARYSRAGSSLQSALAGGGEEQRAVLEVPSWARNREPWL